MASTIKGITVKIGGDTVDLKKALESTTKTSKNLQSELNQVNKLLKFNPDNAALLAQKQELLTEKIGATREALKKLKDVQDDVERQAKNGEISGEQYRAYQREVEQTQSVLQHLETQLKETGDKFSEVQRKSGAVNFKNAEDKAAHLKGVIKDMADSAVENMDKVSKTAETVGTGLEKAGSVLNKGSAAAAAVLAGSVASFKDLDNGYDIIVKKTGATEDAFDSLKATADEIFSGSVFDMSDIGAAIGEVNTRFGYTGDVLKSAAEQYLQFAKVNDADVADSVGKTARIMTAWNLSAESLPDLLGMITAKGQETGVAVSALMDKVLDNNAIFKEMGLSLEESISLMAQFEKNGINDSTALAALKTSVKNATKEGKSLSEALAESVSDIKNATTDTEALQKATELFGTKGAAEMATAIREGRIDFDKLSGSMTEYKDTVKNTYTATLDPLEESKQVLNNLKLAGADLAATALKEGKPLIDDVVKGIKGATDWFKKLSPEQKKVLTKAIEITAVVGPGVSILGKLTKGVGGFVGTGAKMVKALKEATVAQEGLNIAQNANPVGIYALAIAALIGAFVGLKKATEDYQESVWSTSESKKYTDAVDTATAKIKEKSGAIVETTRGTLEALDKQFENTSTITEYQKRLNELLEKAELTPEEEAQLNTIVKYFSDNVDGFSETWNKYTLRDGSGKIKLNADLQLVQQEINNTIEAFKKMAYEKLLQEQYSSVFESMISARGEVQSSQAAQNALRKRFESRLKEIGLSESEFEKILSASGDNFTTVLSRFPDIVKATGLDDASYRELRKMRESYNQYSREVATASANLRIAEEQEKDILGVRAVLNGTYSDAAAVMMAYNAGMITTEQVEQSRWKTVENLQKAAAETGKNTVLGVGQDMDELAQELYSGQKTAEESLNERLAINKKYMGDTAKGATEAVKEQKEPFKSAMGDTLASGRQEFNFYKPDYRQGGKDLTQETRKGMESVDMQETGGNVVLGFLKGMWNNSIYAKIVEVVGNINDSLYEAFKSWWGIHSPADKHAPFVGKNIVLGVLKKMGSMKREIKATGDEVNEAIYQSLTPDKAKFNGLYALSAAEMAQAARNGLTSEIIGNSVSRLSGLKYGEISSTPIVTNTSTTTNNSPIQINVQATVNSDADIDRLAQQLGQKIAQQGVRWG